MKVSKQYTKIAESIREDLELPEIITNDWLLHVHDDSSSELSIWGFCFRDLSKTSFASDIDSTLLRRVSFDTTTIFPKELPVGYEPKSIVKEAFGRCLGIEELIKSGVDGRGVTIAIGDAAIDAIHSENVDNTEYLDITDSKKSSHFHGLIVLANLAGKSIGIAPKAKVLYFPKTDDMTQSGNDSLAALREVVKRNREGAKIRVVNRSGPEPRGLEDEYYALVAELAALDCCVIDSIRFGKDFTCGNFLESPEDVDNIGLSDWQTTGRFAGIADGKMIVPAGGRMVPLWGTVDEYQFVPQSSYSWAIPMLSGIYTLALQVSPQLSYEKFVEIARKTATMNRKGLIIINPKGVIETLLER
ncbi:hypothetical protein CO112_02590 [Candidatus Dojkabacteria bacterium CG_4_9_14_3_um_filter_150_Dojkabacteria_WS6_41_13]|nr:MAG: hypothetical protein CO112_02590 [Candidatus Dojkabacteria bacterium CG_4_9_14_3_um_filter_150_Dojkabacteria_WS6_41_13]